MRASKIGIASRADGIIADAEREDSGAVPVWPWHWRVAFALAAGLAAWIVPIVAIYWLVD